MASVGIIHDAVDLQTTWRWRQIVDAHPAWQARCGEGFVPSASSLRLDHVVSFDLPEVATMLLCSDVGMLVRDIVGREPLLAAEACWVRRQYPPDRYPPGHAPHAWHQDGALGFDWQHADPTREDAMLTMATCWIALDPCGSGLAPGLEIALHDSDRLLTPAELAVLRRGDDFWTATPSLPAGRVVVFGGGLLHRTHVDGCMRSARTSIELRFLDRTSLGRLRARTGTHTGA